MAGLSGRWGKTPPGAPAHPVGGAAIVPRYLADVDVALAFGLVSGLQQDYAKSPATNLIWIKERGIFSS